MPFQVVPRKWWNAEDPKYVISYEAPVSMVFFSHTNTPVCESNYQCGIATRKIQQRHMNRGSVDIVYNFIVGTNGDVFEGRGWYNVPKLHFKHNNYNKVGLHVAFIGDYSEEPPSKDMYEAADALLKLGVEKKFITKKFLLVSSRIATPELRDLAPKDSSTQAPQTFEVEAFPSTTHP